MAISIPTLQGSTFPSFFFLYLSNFIFSFLSLDRHYIFDIFMSPFNQPPVFPFRPRGIWRSHARFPVRRRIFISFPFFYFLNILFSRNYYRIRIIEIILMVSVFLHEIIGLFVIFRRWNRARHSGVGSSYLNLIHSNPRKRLQVFAG